MKCFFLEMMKIDNNNTLLREIKNTFTLYFKKTAFDFFYDTSHRTKGNLFRTDIKIYYEPLEIDELGNGWKC